MVTTKSPAAKTKSSKSKSSTASSVTSSFERKRDTAFHIMSDVAAAKSPTDHELTKAMVQLATASKPLHATIQQLSPHDTLIKNIRKLKDLTEPTKIVFRYQNKTKEMITAKYDRTRIRKGIQKYLQRPADVSEIKYINDEAGIKVVVYNDRDYVVFMNDNIYVRFNLEENYIAYPINTPWDKRFLIPLRWIQDYQPFDLHALVQFSQVHYSKRRGDHLNIISYLNPTYWTNEKQKLNFASWKTNIRGLFA